MSMISDNDAVKDANSGIGQPNNPAPASNSGASVNNGNANSAEVPQGNVTVNAPLPNDAPRDNAKDNQANKVTDSLASASTHGNTAAAAPSAMPPVKPESAALPVEPTAAQPSVPKPAELPPEETPGAPAVAINVNATTPNVSSSMTPESSTVIDQKPIDAASDPVISSAGVKIKDNIGGAKTQPGDDLPRGAEEVSWLVDRYQSTVVQRNLMILLNILSLVCVVISSLSATKIIASKSLDPFVIEIDKKSGIVTLVDQDKVKLYTPDEAVTNYFLLQYLQARELFDPRNYKVFYFRNVRLMSDDKVYKSFLRILRTESKQNPMAAYANNVACSLMVRSMQTLSSGSVQVRFTVEAELLGGKMITRNKIAILSYKYAPMKLSEEERSINPLGFVVTSYNSSDEVI